MNNNRGQLAIEFMATVGFMMVVFLSLWLVYQSESLDTEEYATLISAQKLAREVEMAINEASHIPGMRTTFEVPQVLYGNRPYNITVYDTSVQIFVENRTVIGQLQTVFVRNETHSSPLQLSAGAFVVNETNGGVLVVQS